MIEIGYYKILSWTIWAK